MKKRNKIILSSILLIVLLGIIFATVDYFRAKSDKSPLFAIRAIQHKDGSSADYWGLGYKVIKCSTLSRDKSVHFGFYNINVDKVCNHEGIDNEEEFTVVDETEMCATALELIYEDNNYRYYFPCLKSHTVFIVFKDGQKISVSEAMLYSSKNYEKLITEKYPDLFYKEAKSD